MRPTPPPGNPAPRGYDAVVVGGSSGAIDALMRILPTLPAPLRVPVLVVVHLPRDRPSLLADIFRQRCALPMQEAQDQDQLAPGTVYFAPPDYHLLVDEGPRLALSVDPLVHFSRPAIDVLFESAADHFGERLLGVLLSGANEDGARGIATIAASGGLAVVQDPASAPVPTMPLAALARTPVPHALAPDGIAALLGQFHREGLL
ncbi:chemotaxis protein CheB [Paracidovorax sp. MALMAid1276]|uniref:chemotaxis protein CheB n=1 Tax=Paracidovorax sp. MALMAid1276 TaxID=3411631 RepID=UPI003B9A2E05